MDRRAAAWPPSAAGCFVAGGTGGNLSALTAARHAALARRGERPPGGWRLACTADVHSSIRLAARVLDVGIVEVPEDLRGHLTREALAAALAGESDDIFAVVASGTTNAGLVADLASVAAVCADHGLSWRAAPSSPAATPACGPAIARFYWRRAVVRSAVARSLRI
jgi:glutamate/tyrosine decarboxylase-like PLP-dependent enzyme